MTRNDRFIIAFLFVYTLLIFARTAQFDFVYYDDPEYVFDNPRTRAGLTADSVQWAFRTYLLGNWHPLTLLSYQLDVTVFGARPGAMHIVNAVIHAANAVLLFVVLRAMTGSRWRSALVAALFALHPLHVESVAWIAERKDVLSTFFALLAMLAYVRYARAGSVAAFGLVILALALSLMCKPMFVTLPFLLLVLDWWPLRRWGDGTGLGRLLIEKLPLIVLAAASCLITVIAQQEAMETVPLQVRLINAAYSYVRYLIDMIWPLRLAVLYPLSRVHSQLIGLLSGTFLLGVSVVAVSQRRRFPHLLSGWLWYTGTLVPVIGVVAVGELARADRYTYFPLTGIFMMIVWSIPTPKTLPGRGALSAGAVAILIALSVQTWRQLGYWQNSRTLFERALALVGPHPTLYMNYGLALSASGDDQRAVELYEKALALRPNWAKPLNNMGYSLLRLKQTAEAIECYRAAIKADPAFEKPYIMLGAILLREGNHEEGERLLREALRLAPERADVRKLLNDTLAQQGRPPE